MTVMSKWGSSGASLLLCGSLIAGACGEDNGGWATVDGAPAVLSASHVWAFSPTDVWILDGTATIHRYDGAAWSMLSTPSTMGLGCIYALSATDVWMCAGNDVMHYDGATFTMTNVSSPTGLDSLTSIWASSPADVWAVGDDGIIAHYDGIAWTGDQAGSPFKTSIWGSGPNDIYALSTFDLLHYTNDTWTEVDLDAGAGGGGQVWGTGASDIWLMTGSDRVSHFNGSTWETIELEIVGDLEAVWGPAPDDLWAAGGAGSIAHYDGSEWDEVTHQEIGSPYLRQLRSVHGTSSSDIWIVGHQLGEGGATGLIYHR